MVWGFCQRAKFLIFVKISFQMVIEISDSVLQKMSMTPADLKLEIAVSLYERQILTLEQASKLADLDQLSFQQELGKREIALHYEVSDLESDVQTLKKLGRLK